MSSHKCPAPTCSQRVAVDRFACRGHWYALPKPMRDAIWAGYRSGPLSPAHSAAMADAIAYLRERYPAAR